MIEPTLNYVLCPGASVQDPGGHRMAYWEWNTTGNPEHPHVVVCVHGLTRQARDFDVLAQSLSQHVRVVCPDVVGRGRSDWLADPMGYGLPQYTLDMLALLQQVHRQAPLHMLDWVGTSMGGLIGMCVAGNAQLHLPAPVRKLLLNDVGPKLEWSAIQRIAAYVGKQMHFATEQQAAGALRTLAPGFGPHSEATWMALSAPMLRPVASGGFELHYDPLITEPMQGLTQAQFDQGAEVMWRLYDAIQAQTLLLRGAQSDVLASSTAGAMQKRGPLAQWIDLEGVGHAPTLVSDDQVAIVRKFLLGDE